MRVLILNWKDLAHPAAGGAEVLTEEVARSLVTRGHTVTVFASAVSGRPDRELVDGVEIVRGGGRFTVYRAARRFWSERLPSAPHRFQVFFRGWRTRGSAFPPAWEPRL